MRANASCGSLLSTPFAIILTEAFALSAPHPMRLRNVRCEVHARGEEGGGRGGSLWQERHEVAFVPKAEKRLVSPQGENKEKRTSIY